MGNAGGYKPPSRLLTARVLEGGRQAVVRTVCITQREIAKAVGRKTPESIITPYKLLTGYIQDFRLRRQELITSLSNDSYRPEWVADGYMLWCIQKYYTVYYIKPKQEGHRLPSAAQIEWAFKLPQIQKLYSLQSYENWKSSQKAKQG